ncbi:MAG: cysteine--tRNA ligase [Acidobacteriota bacterium]
MVLSLFNTLSGKPEEFQPLEDNFVRMYTCGPTVYDHAHIGNFRTFVFEDILKRYLRFKGFRVKHVMNITDVDDKTIQNSGAHDVSELRRYTDQFTRAFFEDCEALRVEKPDVVALATEHVPEMVALVEKLRDRGHTYERDGSVYFKLATFKGYGKLSKLDSEGLQSGARVDVDEYEKLDARDFVLWKAPKPGEPYWETSLGPGRPGWHVECSAMSMKYLGETFDLHCGAVDLIFPHHENEIAQSEAATGKPFVQYWVHGEHLIVEGEKMSKSKGNFFTLRQLLQKGMNPVVIRYSLLSVPYKRKLNFTFDAVHQGESALRRLQDMELRLESARLKAGSSEKLADLRRATLNRFEEAMDDDLNTAQGLGALFDFVREVNTALGEGSVFSDDRAALCAVVDRIDEVLQIRLPVETSLPPEVQQLVDQRQQARKERDFGLADRLRAQILEKGYLIEDTKDGIRWKKR